MKWPVKSLLVGVVLAAAAGTALAQAQPYPSRPITLISPFPPGGSTDVVARVMAERMRPLLGQSVVVENVGGAGGSIGVGRVARAAPDGYTIDLGQWDTHVGNGAVYALPYDLQKDFEPVGLLTLNPQLLLARKTIPAENLKELVAWLRANLGTVTLASQTAGAQVAGVLL
jgi:tripartite-type tricarboxylate transporter receptor subunit TctC